ncbi:MAG: AAA family ATPase [Candidatus Dependentiae bacterium]
MNRARILLCLAFLCSVEYNFAEDQLPITTQESVESVSPAAQFFTNKIVPQIEHLAALIAHSETFFIPDSQKQKSDALLTYLNEFEATIQKANSTPINDQFNSSLLQINYGISQEIAVWLKTNFEQVMPFDTNRYLSEPVSLTPEQQEIVFEQINKTLAEVTKEIGEKVQDVLAELVLAVRNQITNLDFSLQKITAIVNNSTHKNKNDLRANITELRSVLQGIQHAIITSPADMRMLVMGHEITRAIITHLANATSNKFAGIQQFDLEKQLKRNPKELPQSIDELKKELAKTSKELAKLQSKAENADLTWVNRLARAFDNHIVTPAQKYHLPTRIGTTLVVTGLATYLWWHFDQHRYADAIPGFRKIFKWSSKQTIIETTYCINDKGENTTVEKPIQDPSRPFGFLKYTEDYLAGVWNAQKPIAKFLMVTTGAAIYKEWKVSISPWLTKKIRATFNRLKGGTYRKIADGIEEIRPTVTFDDVIGLDYAKEMVRPHLKYIKDPERWDANEIAPPTGILLTGPSRTGKTFLARAIQGEINKENPEKGVRFFALDASMLENDSIELWLHMAKMCAPCVIFIDEIDLLGLQRSSNTKRLSEFLQAMSGVMDKDPKKQVIIIATTNRPENLDSALLQNGRFGLEIRFQKPTLKERQMYIMRELNKHAIDPESFGIDLAKLTYETEDASYEDIKAMIDDALIAASIRGEIINQSIFERALDKKIRKIIDVDSKNISDKEKHFMAAHQAGRTLVHLLLNLESKISKVTIRPITVEVKEESVIDQYYKPTGSKQTGTDVGAVFTYHEHDTNDFLSAQEQEKLFKSYLAGRVAEKVILGTCSNYKNGYKQWVFTRLKTMLTEGINIKELSKKDQDRINQQALELIAQYEAEIEKLLRENKEKLALLTDVLRVKQTLSIDEINYILFENHEIQETPAAA